MHCEGVSFLSAHLLAAAGELRIDNSGQKKKDAEKESV